MAYKELMTKKSLIKLIAKVTLSAFALWYVINNIDVLEISNKIQSAKIPLLIAALSIYALSQIAASFRLITIFHHISLKITLKENLKLYWLGLFYNLFLPGGVGGDGFKIFLLEKYLNLKVKESIKAILSDRVSGLTIIVISMLLFTPFIDYPLPLQSYLWLFTPLVAIGFYLFLHLFYKKLKSVYLKITGWSIIVQCLQMATAITILKAIGTELTGLWDDYLLLFLLSSIAGAIPITLGGIGAREVVFMWGAKYLEVDAGNAVTLSLLFYAISAITALPGIIYTINPSAILNKNNKINLTA
ncbi:lysylphosphatidylglycerol synthase transmembrane domain-containing protein [Marinilabiliaceae bacterium ANBcel2]|nr:lysylphosphatidylglycerol synthase transmembrane domain-containing protein [Marinilabiliaceae bacterium ANBcel2]